MSDLILPVAKRIYVCDDVVGDPVSGKVSILNLWETVRVMTFPQVLDKLCVFAQFRSGLGEVPFRVEIVQAGADALIHEPFEFVMQFGDRNTRHDIKCMLRSVVFPRAGTYFAVMHCGGEFVDDQPIRVSSRRF
jgi:hypothetical protein